MAKADGVYCPACGVLVLKTDRRRKQPYLARNGAVLEQRRSEAMAVRCRCGRRVVLLRGSLS